MKKRRRLVMALPVKRLLLGLFTGIAMTALVGALSVSAGEVEKYEAPVQMQTLDTLNVRLSPSVEEGTIMGMLPSGETITVTGKVTDADGALWYEIDYQEQSCYVSSEFVGALEGETVAEEQTEETTEEGKAEGDSEETTKKKKKNKNKDKETDKADKKETEERQITTYEGEEAIGPMEQKSIVKTEDVPNTRAKGHGYRFITYSNGSFDVEVY